MWIGTISYGLYLWHWPVQLVLTPNRTGISGVRSTSCGSRLTVALAAVSYFLVELPIRRGATLRGRVALPSAVAGMAVVAVALVDRDSERDVASPAFATPSPGVTITSPRDPLGLDSGSPDERPTAPRRASADAGGTGRNERTGPGVIGVIGDSVAMSLIPGLERPGVAARHLRGQRRDRRVVVRPTAFCSTYRANPFSWSDDCVPRCPIVQDELITEFHPDSSFG